jgi:hypothetical protein
MYVTAAAVAADTPTVNSNRNAGATQPRRRGSEAPARPGPLAGPGGGHDGAGAPAGGNIADGGASFDHGELLTFMLPIDSVKVRPLRVCRDALKGLFF